MRKRGSDAVARTARGKKTISRKFKEKPVHLYRGTPTARGWSKHQEMPVLPRSGVRPARACPVKARVRESRRRCP
jgi:hypothetical protein